MSDIIRQARILRARAEPPFIDDTDTYPPVGPPTAVQKYDNLMDLFYVPDRDKAQILDMPLRGKEEAPPPDSPYYKQYMLDQYLKNFT